MTFSVLLLMSIHTEIETIWLSLELDHLKLKFGFVANANVLLGTGHGILLQNILNNCFLYYFLVFDNG